MSNNKKPMVLVILDGYGHREERQDNAILNAGTPVMDRLWREQPHTLIAASGLDVGLPDGLGTLSPQPSGKVGPLRRDREKPHHGLHRVRLVRVHLPSQHTSA